MDAGGGRRTLGLRKFLLLNKEENSADTLTHISLRAELRATQTSKGDRHNYYSKDLRSILDSFPSQEQMTYTSEKRKLIQKRTHFRGRPTAFSQSLWVHINVKYVCMYVEGVGQKSGPCTATFNDLLCFPYC
jgi:hypothetical protein